MYAPSRHVRSCEVDGAAILLDLSRGVYIALDSVGTDVWRALFQYGDVAGVEFHLSQRYVSAPGQIHTEVEGFLRRCLEQRLVRLVEVPAADAAPQVVERSALHALSLESRFPFVSAWLSLFKITRLLARKGFGQCYSAIAALPKPAAYSASADRVSSAVETFLKAENVFWLKDAPNDCLARSMALYRFLLSLGFGAAHRIGVRQSPFFAHAWVESGGQPLLETAEVTGQFRVISEL